MLPCRAEFEPLDNPARPVGAQNRPLRKLAPATRAQFAVCYNEKHEFRIVWTLIFPYPEFWKMNSTLSNRRRLRATPQARGKMAHPAWPEALS